MSDETSFIGGYTRTPNEFICSNVSNSSFRLYCVLIKSVNIPKHGDTRVFPSWKELKEQTRIQSNETLSNAITELVETGWIKDITTQMNNSNIYFMAFTPEPNEELITKRHLQREARSKIMKKISQGKRIIKKEKHAKK